MKDRKSAVSEAARMPKKVRELLKHMSGVACYSWPKCNTEEMRGFRCFCCRARDIVGA